MTDVFFACEASEENAPFSRRDYERVLRYSLTYTCERHTICKNPADADIIAFIGSSKPGFIDITSSALYKNYRDKCVIFYSGDRAIPILPGIYTCLENSCTIRHRKSVTAGFYLRVTDNYSLDSIGAIENAKWLYSFLGNSKNHKVRESVCALPTQRSYIKDSSTDARHQDDGISGENKDRGRLYNAVMENSKFVLCPRGIGVSTWRVFETMRAGRVPVIIADDWLQPAGPEWEKFSIRVRENQVSTIPDILENQEYLAAEFGAKARSEWKRFYSDEQVLNTLIDQLASAKAGFSTEHPLSRVLTGSQYFHPFFLRHWILSPAKSYIKQAIANKLAN